MLGGMGINAQDGVGNTMDGGVIYQRRNLEISVRQTHTQVEKAIQQSLYILKG